MGHQRNWSSIWLHSIYINSLLCDAQEIIYPFQRLPAYSTAEQFALKEFMMECIKAMYLPILCIG